MITVLFSVVMLVLWGWLFFSSKTGWAILWALFAILTIGALFNTMIALKAGRDVDAEAAEAAGDGS